jgi:DNA-binding transcriptional LysR family regulator
MELRQLEHFLAVARTGSFTRAARQLDLVQSALSSSVRTLEVDLGAQLFQRLPRQVVLTPAGTALRPIAQQILDGVRAAREEMAAINGLQRGELSLGSFQAMSNIDLPLLLQRFHRAYPGVHVTLRDAENPEKFLEEVRCAAFDLTFTPLDGVTLPPDLVALHVDREELVLVVAPDHALADQEDVALADLLQERFIDFRAGTGLQRAIERLWVREGLVPYSSFQVSQLDQMLSLVARGLGVAIVPLPIARRRSLRPVRLRADDPYRTVGLVCRAPAPANPAARAFVKLFRELIAA